MSRKVQEMGASMVSDISVVMISMLFLRPLNSWKSIRRVVIELNNVS